MQDAAAKDQQAQLEQQAAQDEAAKQAEQAKQEAAAQLENQAGANSMFSSILSINISLTSHRRH